MLARLVLAPEQQNVALAKPYKVDCDAFLLALDLIKGWRLDRYYYTAKGELLHMTLQLTEAKHQIPAIRIAGTTGTPTGTPRESHAK
jgi:hypothetical protein